MEELQLMKWFSYNTDPLEVGTYSCLVIRQKRVIEMQKSEYANP